MNWAATPTSDPAEGDNLAEEVLASRSGSPSGKVHVVHRVHLDPLGVALLGLGGRRDHRDRVGSLLFQTSAEREQELGSNHTSSFSSIAYILKTFLTEQMKRS